MADNKISNMGHHRLGLFYNCLGAIMQGGAFKSSFMELKLSGFAITTSHIPAGRLCCRDRLIYDKGNQVQTDNKFFDDLAKLGQSAAGTLHGVKGEVEAMIRARLEHIFRDMNLVTREEFDVVRDMAREAREKNLELEQKIATLKKPRATRKTTRPAQGKNSKESGK